MTSCTGHSIVFLMRFLGTRQRGGDQPRPTCTSSSSDMLQCLAISLPTLSTTFLKSPACLLDRVRRLQLQYSQDDHRECLATHVQPRTGLDNYDPNISKI